jgi:hypothetical protein
MMVAQRTMRNRKLARNYPMQELALVTCLNDTTELAHRGLDPDTLGLDCGIGVYHFVSILFDAVGRVLFPNIGDCFLGQNPPTRVRTPLVRLARKGRGPAPDMGRA